MIIPNSDQQTGTWSGGIIQSIYMHLPGANVQANNYQFWVNIATIEREARYSYFPGYQRLHLPLTAGQPLPSRPGGDDLTTESESTHA